MLLTFNDLTENQNQQITDTMLSYDYPIPKGCHAIPTQELDLRPDTEIDTILLNPPPVPQGHEKNIWFFWHSGYATMQPYAKRTVRTYHRRFARKGWTVRVVDVVPASPGHVAHFVDVADPTLFPRAFREGTITGTYARQHTSDLVRWPLLLRYGGVYADVGLMPIGDIDALWEDTVGRTAGPHPVTGKRYEVLSYTSGGAAGGGGDDDDDTRTVDEAMPDLMNYFLCARPHNAYFLRCHRLFLALWDEEGGRTSTDGMHKSPLLQGVPLLGDQGQSMEYRTSLSDYITQGQVVKMVTGTVDEADGWNGPQYVQDHWYTMEFMVGSQLINEMTAWDGHRAFALLSLALPEKDGTAAAAETEDQTLAREIVEACLSKSFGFKLAHGMIIAVLGETLGSLWRAHEGSDDVPGTYAHWLRYGMIYWSQDLLPPTVEFSDFAPFKRGSLLGEK